MSGITLKEVVDTTVPTPATDKNTLFFDAADGEPKYKDDTGTVTPLKGDPGEGVPPGGTAGQVLSKVDGTDYNTEWVDASGSATAPVVAESGTSLAASSSNSGNYTRFTNAAAKTYTFDDAEAFIVGAEYHGRNAGAGDLTITEAGAMTINPPAGGTLIIPQGGTFTVKIVASDEADLFGVTVSV